MSKKLCRLTLILATIIVAFASCGKEEEYDEEEEEEDDDRPPKKPRHGGFILDEAGM